MPLQMFLAIHVSFNFPCKCLHDQSLQNKVYMSLALHVPYKCLHGPFKTILRTPSRRFRELLQPALRPAFSLQCSPEAAPTYNVRVCRHLHPVPGSATFRPGLDTKATYKPKLHLGTFRNLQSILQPNFFKACPWKFLDKAYKESLQSSPLHEPATAKSTCIGKLQTKCFKFMFLQIYVPSNMTSSIRFGTSCSDPADLTPRFLQDFSKNLYTCSTFKPSSLSAKILQKALQSCIPATMARADGSSDGSSKPPAT